jgi:hypothetical protein
VKRFKVGAVVVMACLLAVGSASALLVTDSLANLAANPNNAIGFGDKVFDNFTYTASGLTDFDANLIEVTASEVGGVYYLTWAGSIGLVSVGPGVADLLLGYDLTATAGAIDWIDQSYTGSAQPAGGAYLSVDESVYDGVTIVANSHLQVGDLSDPFAEAGDDLILVPSLSFVHVTKDIGLGIVNGGFVTISEVKQSFHQPVPDGGMTVALMGLALAGVATLRRLIG